MQINFFAIIYFLKILILDLCKVCLDQIITNIIEQFHRYGKF